MLRKIFALMALGLLAATAAQAQESVGEMVKNACQEDLDKYCPQVKPGNRKQQPGGGQLQPGNGQLQGGAPKRNLKGAGKRAGGNGILQPAASPFDALDIDSLEAGQVLSTLFSIEGKGPIQYLKDKGRALGAVEENVAIPSLAEPDTLKPGDQLSVSVSGGMAGGMLEKAGPGGKAACCAASPLMSG